MTAAAVGSAIEIAVAIRNQTAERGSPIGAAEVM